MAKVSICIPCRSHPKEFVRLLASVAQQTMRDYEVCVSDDSSDGELEEQVHRFAKEFPAGAVRYVRNETPLGHVVNWNAAISMAQGAYIKIMFSDDWFTDAQALMRYTEMLDRHPEADLAFSGSRQVTLTDRPDALKHLSENVQTEALTEEGFPYYDRHAEEAFVGSLARDYRYLFTGDQIGAPSAVIFRRGDRKLSFDEESSFASDVMLYFSVLAENPHFAWTEEPLVCIGVHEHQYTETFARRDERVYRDYRRLYEQYGLGGEDVYRTYMTREYIVPYHKGIREARALGISDRLYLREWARMQRETLRCFVRARFVRGSA